MSSLKFNFIPEYQLVENKTVYYHKASVLSKGRLSLGGKYIDDEGLEGKYVQFYQLKSATESGIGWRVIEGETSVDILNHCKQIKNNVNGGAVVSVTKILYSIGKYDKVYKKVDIQRYAPIFGENAGKSYHYIILNGGHEQPDVDTDNKEE